MPHFDILGAPIGDLVFCAKFVAQKQSEASKLVKELEAVGSIDPQVALLLLRQCGSYCRLVPVADAGFKERGGCSGGGSPKGGGCGRGMCPLPREARKLLKMLIRCAKMHEKITSFFYLSRILRIM